MCDEGWFWLIGIDERRTSVGFVTSPALAKQVGVDARRMLDWAVRRAPVVRDRLADATGPADNRVVSDFSYTCAPFAGPGYFLVGDAASFLDPMFSTGVTLALRGGMEAGRAALAVLDGGVKPARAARRYDRFVARASDVFRHLIRGYYDHGFRELFLHGRGPLGVHRAVINVLAGNVFPKPAWRLRWRLRLFYHFVNVQRKRGPRAPRAALLPTRRRAADGRRRGGRAGRGGRRGGRMTPPLELLERVQRHAIDRPAAPAFEDLSTGRRCTYADLVDAMRSPTLADESGVVRVRGRRSARNPAPVSGRAFQEPAGIPRDGVHGTARGRGAVPAPAKQRLDRDAEDRAAAGGGARRGERADGGGAGPLRADDVILAAVPLTHSYGLEHGLLAPLWAGSTVLLAQGLNVPQLQAGLAQGATVLPWVPAMWERATAMEGGRLVAGCGWRIRPAGRCR